MKKILSFLLTMVLCFNLVGCTEGGKSEYVQLKVIGAFLISDMIVTMTSEMSVNQELEVLDKITENKYQRSKAKEYLGDLIKKASDKDMKSAGEKLEKAFNYEEKMFDTMKESPGLALLEIITNYSEYDGMAENHVIENAHDEISAYARDSGEVITQYKEKMNSIRSKVSYIDGDGVKIEEDFKKPFLEICSYTLQNIINAQDYLAGFQYDGRDQVEYLESQLYPINCCLESLESFQNKLKKSSKEYKAAHELFLGFEKIDEKYSAAIEEHSNRETEEGQHDLIKMKDVEPEATESLSNYKKIMSGEEVSSNYEEDNSEPYYEELEDSYVEPETDVKSESKSNNGIDFNEFFASASSVLPNEPGFTYLAKNVNDFNKDTCWAENVHGDGIGEFIQYNNIGTDEEVTIKGVKIINGCCNSKEAFNNNNRAKKVLIQTDNEEVEVTLDDLYGEEQTIKFDTPIKTNSLKLYIKSVYPGAKYQDTCIAEFRPY